MECDFFINNPIHQNYGHIKCLQDILELDNFAYYNVVCFANRTKVKIDDKKDNEIICNLDFLNNEILSKKSIKIDTDINDIKSIILSKNIVDKAEKNKHVENVKVIKREKFVPVSPYKITYLFYLISTVSINGFVAGLTFKGCSPATSEMRGMRIQTCRPPSG